MTFDPTPSHLIPQESDRGLKYMPYMHSICGKEVRIYESNNVKETCVWLRISHVTAELSLKTLRELRDQADYLLENHYRLTSATSKDV